MKTGPHNKVSDLNINWESHLQQLKQLDKNIRQLNLNLKKYFAIQEEKRKHSETWLTGHQLNKLTNVNLLTLRRKNQVETRVAATGGIEYLLESIPQQLLKINQ